MPKAQWTACLFSGGRQRQVDYLAEAVQVINASMLSKYWCRYEQTIIQDLLISGSIVPTVKHYERAFNFKLTSFVYDICMPPLNIKFSQWFHSHAFSWRKPSIIRKIIRTRLTDTLFQHCLDSMLGSCLFWSKPSSVNQQSGTINVPKVSAARLQSWNLTQQAITLNFLFHVYLKKAFLLNKFDPLRHENSCSFPFSKQAISSKHNFPVWVLSTCHYNLY